VLTGQTQSEMIFINDEVIMKPFLDIFSAAMELETRTQVTNEETRKLFRFSEQERSEKKDGLSLATNGFEGIMLKIAEKSLKNGDSLTWHSEKMVQATMKSINKSIYSSKGIIFFKTSNNEKTDWLNTGRDFARYNIAIAKMGLATSHYNQVIQEYPEMRILQNEFDTLTKTRGNEKIQIIVRVGRAKPTYKSWRRNPEDFLIKK
jgi:formyltetrahydrofolate synthetase